ncbi:MAG: glycerol dehydrogenase [Francisellaceae bacterium]|jgi:glycerol dehydrogenase
MRNKAVFPGKYIQGSDALNELPELVQLLGNRGLIVASPTAKNKILPQYSMPVNICVETFNGECCELELTRLAKLIVSNKINVLVGMGGGKTIDAVKIAADRANIPVIIIPTIASSDAPCSSCAVLYTQDGIYEDVLYQKSSPSVVLVDSNIISQAPTRFLVSGMGDALATWFESRSCQITKSNNECGGLSTLAGLSIAKLCYKTLFKYGELAVISSNSNLVTPALEHIIESNILLSGIGFESSGLASAHAIHNGLTALSETHNYYHGEKVAFGVLAGLHLTDAKPKEISKVYAFCEAIGLPTTLADIGLVNAKKDYLILAAEKACEVGQSIHHESGIITAEKVLQAILMADAVGDSRQASYVGGSNRLGSI